MRLVQVYTGQGKGKTTAALGAVLRAVGQGLRVYIVHFMKGTYPYGEQKALAQFPSVTVARFGQLSFVDPRDVKSEDKREAEKALIAAREAMTSGQYDLIVLDEINVASAWGLVGIDEVVQMVREKPADVELILTGRSADPRIIELADLVTEMVEVKHPFAQGVKARRGFEY